MTKKATQASRDSTNRKMIRVNNGGDAMDIDQEEVNANRRITVTSVSLLIVIH